jgi:hypothetical protein
VFPGSEFTQRFGRHDDPLTVRAKCGRAATRELGPEREDEKFHGELPPAQRAGPFETVARGGDASQFVVRAQHFAGGSHASTVTRYIRHGLTCVAETA